MALSGLAAAGVVALVLGCFAWLLVLRRRIRSEIRRLRKREHWRQLALNAGGDELWQYDVGADRITRENQLPGLSQAEKGSRTTVQAFLENVHADDRERARSAMVALIAGRADQTDISYRWHRGSGGWSWVHTRGHIVARDAAGKASVIVGTSREISAIKHNADRLSLALQAAGEELWELDIARDSLVRDNPTEHGTDLDRPDRSAREGFFRVCHPDDIAHVRQAYLDVRWGNSETLHVVYRVRSKDGGYRWMESHGRGTDPDDNRHPTRMIGTNRDITALKEGEERLRLVLWGSGTELWDIDMGSMLIQRSNKLPGLCINAHGDSIGFADLLAAVAPEDAPGLGSAFVAHAKAMTDAYEISFRVRDTSGEWRWMYSHGRIVERSETGWALRMAGIMHDITAVKQTEEALRRLNEELEDRVASRTADLSHANTELNSTIERLGQAQTQLVESEKMAALGSLVSGVAHEINTPLGISVTAASHLGEEIERIEIHLRSDDPDTAELRESTGVMRQCIDLVQRNLERADQLVRSFKQVSVDQSTEQSREIVLKDYLDEILLSFSTRIKRAGHSFSLDCPATIRLETYPGAIYKAITNLVLNSLVHGFDGITAGAIAIDVRAYTDHVLLLYSDNGLGMLPEVRRRVFDPFFTTRRGLGGAGLGMHITYNLITQRLGGSIKCTSEPDAGVMFEIRIPLRAHVQPAGAAR
jgi:signal transduction histidine kinase